MPQLGELSANPALDSKMLQCEHLQSDPQANPVNVCQFSIPVPQTHICEAPPSLTTEYTLRERGTPSKPAPLPITSVPQTSPVHTSTTPDTRVDEGPDPSTLPPAIAPPSYPSINPDLPGMLDGRSILEVDLHAMTEKPWRRPGSDISDWFNYGFDEISWEAYCYRRLDVGELADVLKTNVLVRVTSLLPHIPTQPVM